MSVRRFPPGLYPRHGRSIGVACGYDSFDVQAVGHDSLWAVGSCGRRLRSLGQFRFGHGRGPFVFTAAPRLPRWPAQTACRVAARSWQVPDTALYDAGKILQEVKEMLHKRAHRDFDFLGGLGRSTEFCLGMSGIM